MMVEVLVRPWESMVLGMRFTEVSLHVQKMLRTWLNLPISWARFDSIATFGRSQTIYLRKPNSAGVETSLLACNR